jgi:hypothetical protein
MLRSVVSLGSGSSEGQPKVHWFTKSDSVYLHKYVCWMCGYLIYCCECKKFECVLGHLLSRDACQFRKDGEIVRL